MKITEKQLREFVRLAKGGSRHYAMVAEHIEKHKGEGLACLFNKPNERGFYGPSIKGFTIRNTRSFSHILTLDGNVERVHCSKVYHTNNKIIGEGLELI